MEDLKNSFSCYEFGGKSNVVQVKLFLECLNRLKVLMREMAMYYYACKLSSMASCSSGRNREGKNHCGNASTSASNPMPTTSDASGPSTSSAGCTYCSRYKHKSKHKVNKKKINTDNCGIVLWYPKIGILGGGGHSESPYVFTLQVRNPKFWLFAT